MMEKDQEVRKRWVQSKNDLDAQAGIGSEIRAVDATNSARLRGIVAKYGWPGISLVGKKGAAAAWTIVQHSEPILMRQCLESYEGGGREGRHALAPRRDDDRPASSWVRASASSTARSSTGTWSAADRRRNERGQAPRRSRSLPARRVQGPDEKVYGVETPSK